MVDGSTDAIVELFNEDALMSFLRPFVLQATAEFPEVLASLRARLPVDDGPIGVLGGSLGGAVALRILTNTGISVFAGAIVNGAIRVRSVVDLFPGDYTYDTESEKAADSLDFVAKAGTVAARAPLLVVSGELDHPALRADDPPPTADPLAIAVTTTDREREPEWTTRRDHIPDPGARDRRASGSPDHERLSRRGSPDAGDRPDN
ncbi:hypothetical protein [Actinokineospora sp. NBRC 105648]|uniref:alpha/beta hydrolase family protein n=1 Tax=Actinokineospora sp. NBRC 105648 TaxID=3032206 RepID=UPI0025523CAD|nr:hypothetical protein [Actinokineospora sp. NBRC 105648]